MEPELEKRLTRIENMLAHIICNGKSDQNLRNGIIKIYDPPKTERPDLWDEKKSAEAEAKKKHIKKYSKLPPKEKAERIVELTKKAFQ